jgi:hypothetical protein
VDETVRLRRQLGERPKNVGMSRSSSTPASPTPATKTTGEAPPSRLREFRDEQGREWRAWEVKPGSTGRRINPERYLGEYVKGWLAFECQQEEVRKRLANHPPDWFRMGDSELDRLLPRAVDVPKRGPKAPGAPTD